MDKLTTFLRRMQKLGIEITLFGNYPWVYIDTINGKRVKENFHGNHGFTVMFRAARIGQEDSFTELSEIFKLIRKYI